MPTTTTKPENTKRQNNQKTKTKTKKQKTENVASNAERRDLAKQCGFETSDKVPPCYPQCTCPSCTLTRARIPASSPVVPSVHSHNKPPISANRAEPVDWTFILGPFVSRPDQYMHIKSATPHPYHPHSTLSSRPPLGGFYPTSLYAYQRNGHGLSLALTPSTYLSQ